MANDIEGFKTDLLSALTGNFDSTSLTKLGNRFIARYPSEWNRRIVDGMPDTPANRGKFVADMIYEGINLVYRSGSQQEIDAAKPPAEELG